MQTRSPSRALAACALAAMTLAYTATHREWMAADAVRNRLRREVATAFDHYDVILAPIALFAFCCGAIVANLYYAQPITELIAPDSHMSSDTASLIVSVTQIACTAGSASWAGAPGSSSPCVAAI